MSRFIIEPWGALPRSAVRDKSLGASELRVLAAISAFQGTNEKAWPSIQDLCEWTEYAETTIKASISILKRTGHVVVQRRFNATNVYRITWNAENVQSVEQTPRSVPQTDTTGCLTDSHHGVSTTTPYKTSSTTKSPHQSVIKAFHDLYVENSEGHTKPTWSDIQTSAVKRLLKHHSAEEVVEVIKKYFGIPFWFTKGKTYSIVNMAQHYDDIASAAWPGSKKNEAKVDSDIVRQLKEAGIA